MTKFIDKYLYKVIAFLLIVTIFPITPIILTPTYALGGLEYNTSDDLTSDKDLTGGCNFTNLYNGGNDVTKQGVYTYEDDNYKYLMFTNKKAPTGTYYRTVGFNLHETPSTTLGNGDNQSRTNLVLPDSYPSDYTGQRIENNSGMALEFGGPSGSSITSEVHSKSRYDTDDGIALTTTCFKLNKDVVRRAYINTGKSLSGTKYLSAINIIRLTDETYHNFPINSRWGYTHSEAYSDVLQAFNDIGFSEASKSTLPTYYNIPIEIDDPIMDSNAVTYINVGGTGLQELKTEIEPFNNTTDFTKTFNTITKINDTNYRIAGVAIVPYSTFGSEKEDNTSCNFIRWTNSLTSKNRYYPNFLSFISQEVYRKITDRFGTGSNATVTPSVAQSNCWYKSGTASNELKFTDSFYSTDTGRDFTITNTARKVGTQVYVFVTPTDAILTGQNLVFYDDSTGEALATGTVHYDVWYNKHKTNPQNPDYNKNTSLTMFLSDWDIDNGDIVTIDNNISIREDTLSVVTGQNRGLHPSNENIYSIDANYCKTSDFTFSNGGKTIPQLTGSKETTGAAKYQSSIMLLKFPSSVRTQSGKKLIFKGVEAKFNTTVNEDIEKTRKTNSGNIDLSAATDILDSGYFKYNADNISCTEEKALTLLY